MFRLLHPDDIEPMSQLLQDKEVMRNLKSLSYPYQREAAVRFVEQVQAQRESVPPMFGVQEGGKTCWAIEHQGRFAGTLGLRLGEGAEEGDFTVGYWLGRPFWGQGLASRALRQACGWAFERASARRISAHVYAWNPASIRVLLKNGFQSEGCKRRAIVRFGETTDLLGYGLLPEEFFQMTQMKE